VAWNFRGCDELEPNAQLVGQFTDIIFDVAAGGGN
jgi:hypothetical protein